MTTLPPTGNTAVTRPENRVFYPALDGLRAVAFAMVLGQHYLSLAWGWTGVNVFFVLSGFLITGILFDSMDDPHRVRNFYVRRTLRIFPLFYGVFALLLLLEPVMRWRWSAYWFAWPLYLGNFLRFVSPAAQIPHTPLEYAADAHLTGHILPRTELYLGHLWSLCVEEQFYLLWPWVVFLVRGRRRLIGVCTAAVVAVPVARGVAQAYAPSWMLHQELLYRFTPFQLDSLLLGGLLALLWRGPARERLLQAGRVLAAAGTVCWLGYLLFVVRGWRMEATDYPSWHFTGGITFVNVYAAAVILCALRPGTVVYRLLQQRPLRFAGRLTYGAYVFHDIFHKLFTHVVWYGGGHAVQSRPALAGYLTAAFAFFGTLLLAWVSFRFFESPFLNLKDRWTISAPVR